MTDKPTVNSVTFSFGAQLAFSRFNSKLRPGNVYVVGDEPEYGCITIGEDGAVKGQSVYPFGGVHRKDFIGENKGDRFRPASQAALDDLNSYGFMLSEADGWFEIPLKKK